MAEILPAKTVKVVSVTSTAATTQLTRTKANVNANGGAHAALFTNVPKGVRITNRGLGNNTGSVVNGRAFGGATAVTAVTDAAATFQVAPGATVVLPVDETSNNAGTYTVNLSLKLPNADAATDFALVSFVDKA